MASPEKVYREFFKRTHRTLAAYLALVAWIRNLDCVAIDREEIVSFWGLAKRVENQRLEWLKSDIKQFFPYVEALFSQGTEKFGSVFLARREFPSDSFAVTMPDKDRTQFLTDKGFHTEVVSLPAEVSMLTQLTVVIHGLAPFPSRHDSISAELERLKNEMKEERSRRQATAAE